MGWNWEGRFFNFWDSGNVARDVGQGVGKWALLGLFGIGLDFDRQVVEAGGVTGQGR